jgi:hypothetical protein
VDQSRVIRVLRRIAHDLEELARARRVADLSSSGNDADPRMRLRRRHAEPRIELSRRGTSILQGRKASENYEHRLQKAGLPAPLNPYPSAPQSFSGVNSLTLFAVRLLPRPP